jgi:hypothetical protein
MRQISGASGHTFTATTTLSIPETVHILDTGKIVITQPNPPTPSNTLTLNIAGDLIIDTPAAAGGDGIFADYVPIAPSQAAGVAGTIIINANGNANTDGTIILHGDGTNGGTISAEQTYTGSCNGGFGGNIELIALGDITTEDGSLVTVGSFSEPCPAGSILIQAALTIDIDGVVKSESGLSGTGAVQPPGGGPITIISTNSDPSKTVPNENCDILISGTGIVSSLGRDPGADLVHIEGCRIVIYGLVQSTGVGHAIPNSPHNHCDSTNRPDKPSSSTACVEIWAGSSLIIDNSTAGRNGQINADTGGPGGSTGTSWIDLFSRGDMQILGTNSLGHYAVHANGNAGTSDNGGVVTVKSTTGKITASGFAVQASALNSGGQGGEVDVEANQDVDLSGGTLQARGTLTGGAPHGGTIYVQSFNGNIVSDANSVLDVTGGNPSTGVVTLTACGTIGFPPGTVTPVSPTKTTGTCGGEPTLPDYVQLPLCLAITTQLSSTQIVVGESVTDSATLTGASSNAGGTVTYKLFSTSDCSGSPLATDTQTVTNGFVPPSNPFTLNSVGSFQFQAEYSGDANNNAATSTCGTEALTVNPATPSISTEIHDPQHNPVTSVSVGTFVHDKATVTGGFNPTGNVKFSRYSTTDCTGPSVDQTVALSGDSAESSSFQLTSTSSISYQATYLGDDNNNPSAPSDCEPLTVNPASPGVTTEIHDQQDNVITSATLGTVVHDVATVTSGFNPTGDVTFMLFTNVECTGTHTDETVALSGDSAVSSTTTFLAPLGYEAEYLGDSNNNPATSACEPLSTVSVTTELSALEVNIGDPVTDQATLGGVTGDAGGTVTYKVFGPNDLTCQPDGGQPTFTSTKPVTNGAVDPSDPFTPTAAGTYEWIAVYSGDAKNLPASSTCGNEPLIVDKSSPGITTEIHDPAHNVITSATVGTLVHDKATVTGGSSPTGNVKFSRYSTGDCTGPSVDQTVALSGGSAESSSFQLTSTSSISYQATYLGDANNNQATSDCEPLTVNPASPGVTTEIHDPQHNPVTSVSFDTFVHDKATVTGGFNPTGNVKFSRYSTTDCTGPSVDQTVALSGGSAESSSFHVTSGISYKAIYLGDGNNNQATSACEPLEVTPAIVPEYPLGLALLVVFMVIGYGLIKRIAAPPEKWKATRHPAHHVSTTPNFFGSND